MSEPSHDNFMTINETLSVICYSMSTEELSSIIDRVVSWDVKFSNELEVISKISLILHHFRLKTKSKKYSHIRFNNRVGNLYSFLSRKHDIPAAGSLESLFFYNYVVINGKIKPKYSWCHNDDTYFDAFFSSPIMVELKAMPFYYSLMNGSKPHLVLHEMLDAMASVKQIFATPALSMKVSTDSFMRDIQPFMSWGDGYSR